MRPVASLLLRCGMTWKEFAELCKSVFVEVASEEYGIKGRMTNVSRVSILTGMSRKEVKRQRELLEAHTPPAEGKTTDATRVLSGWHQDKDFLDQDGKPLPLPLDGKGATFAELMRRYGGDIPQGAMLKELKNAKAVEDTEDGKLRAISRYYSPVRMDPELLLIAGSNLRDLAATLNYNLSIDEGKRFEGRADNDTIDAKVLPAFRKLMEEEGQRFLEKLDDWLSAHQVPDNDKADAKRVRLGVGIYAIEDMANKRGQK